MACCRSGSTPAEDESDDEEQTLELIIVDSDEAADRMQKVTDASAAWMTGVMQKGKKIPNWVWPGDMLKAALEADNPTEWNNICMRFEQDSGSKKGTLWAWFIRLCEDSPNKFVLIGEQEDGSYIACKVAPTPQGEKDHAPSAQMIKSTHLQLKDSGRTTGLCSGWFHCCGFILNICWCIFWYVLPNCCCAWRWFCCRSCVHDFDDIEEEIETGDVILFCGTMSTRIGGESHWSHAAICLRDTKGEHGPPGLLYVFEANFGRPGWNHCDIRLLREKLETYKGGKTDMAWRPLYDADDETRQKISAAILKNRGAPYDHNMKRMAMAALDCCPCVEMEDQGHGEMFCSQCVAQVLIDAGVLPGPPVGPASGEYMPRDFDIVPSGGAEHAALTDVLGDMYRIKRFSNKWTGLSCR